MEVELLVVPGCPNEQPTIEMLRGMLDRLGLPPASLRVDVIATQREASRRRFIGSPTVLVNGLDLFARPEQPPALACRLYRSPRGTSGCPDPEALWAVLSATAALEQRQDTV